MSDDAARLHARPDGGALRATLRDLPGRALVHVPPGVDDGRPAPLAVALHGAGGSAAATLSLLRGAADAANVILLAPQARGSTWDVIEGGFGPDVACLDAVLALVFARVPVDPARIALAGFSDGASYALSLGLGNGDFVTHLIAFSPGFTAPAAARGRPRVFVSHGTDDRVLPIDRCSRRIVPRLRAAGYDVVYEEFHGGHVVPPAVAQRALEWFEQV
jgi:phospholipase/carboxylesterase